MVGHLEARYDFAERMHLHVTQLRLALRRGALIAFISLAALALVACGGGTTDPGDGASGGGTISVANGVAEVSADDLSFDAGTIQAPAGEDFVLRFTNNENMPHNLSVYTEEGGTQIAVGNIINEGETDEVAVAALEPGEYFFVCDVHPNEMTGVLVVEG